MWLLVDYSDEIILQQPHVPEQGQGDDRHEREKERESDLFMLLRLEAPLARMRLFSHTVHVTRGDHGIVSHMFVLLLTKKKRVPQLGHPFSLQGQYTPFRDSGQTRVLYTTK